MADQKRRKNEPYTKKKKIQTWDILAYIRTYSNTDQILLLGPKHVGS